MKQPSRFPNGIWDSRSTLAKTDDYTITESDVKEYQAVSINGTTKTLTLPAASAAMKGATLLLLNLGSNAACKATVVAGFGGGGGSYDYVTFPAYASFIAYCNGSVWSIFGSVDPASS
jgi:hypothetical protein